MGSLYQSWRTAFISTGRRAAAYSSAGFLSLLNSLSLQIPGAFLPSFIHRLLKPGEIEATQPSRLLSNQTKPFLQVSWAFHYLEGLWIRLVSDMNATSMHNELYIPKCSPKDTRLFLQWQHTLTGSGSVYMSEILRCGASYPLTPAIRVGYCRDWCKMGE